MTCSKDIAAAIAQADSIVALAHIHPDGDSLGTLRAFAAGATAAGKRVDLVLQDPIPYRYRFLFADQPVADGAAFAGLAGEADAVLIADTCSYSQLGPIGEQLGPIRDKLVVMDHHATRDELCERIWTDTSAAAVGLMMLEVLEELGWDLPAPAPTALAAAILTDTGWLRFSNTDPRAMRAMARLLERGVPTADLYERIFHADRLERLKLLERVLNSLTLYADGRLAMMMLRDSDFAEVGARRDETENLINEAMRIESVEVATMLIQDGPLVRGSLRSRRLVDVSSVARGFGGGGHERAAGFRQETDIDALAGQVRQAVEKDLRA